ncbi:MAG: hypothetical protein DRO11_02195 [Methanobacteriota archaeon]|nr:MAG: hypothetical protein DRO11_02195 [Euryarchaeota archaeon]
MRTAQAVEGQLSYGIETVPYTKEVPATTFLGYLEEDTDLPNGQNPHEPMVAGGTKRRGPHCYAKQKRAYEFSIPITVYDHNVPLETALGLRTITDVENLSFVKVADKHTFTETNALPTMTLEHAHLGLDFIEHYIGCKSNLSISIADEELVKATLDIVGASYDLDDSPSSIPDLVIPCGKSPFAFLDVALIKVGAKVVATIKSAELNWDNGLTAQHHGNGRDAYAISEDTAKDKYDMKMTVNVVDLDLLKRAYNNEDPVAVEIRLTRHATGDATVDDGFNVFLTDCRILNAPIPKRPEGVLESEITLAPRNTSIEIITPI